MKSTNRRPLASAMYASRMFHSSGTVQSRTFVPDGTSLTVSGTIRPITSSVARTPSPVIERQIG